MEKPHDYVVYVYWWSKGEKAGGPKVEDKLDMHAGESETSNTLVSRPDLVHMDRANQESGADLHRQNLPPGVYTGGMRDFPITTPAMAPWRPKNWASTICRLGRTASLM